MKRINVFQKNILQPKLQFVALFIQCLIFSRNSQDRDKIRY